MKNEDAVQRSVGRKYVPSSVLRGKKKQPHGGLIAHWLMTLWSSWSHRLRPASEEVWTAGKRSERGDYIEERRNAIAMSIRPVPAPRCLLLSLWRFLWGSGTLIDDVTVWFTQCQRQTKRIPTQLERQQTPFLHSTPAADPSSIRKRKRRHTETFLVLKGAFEMNTISLKMSDLSYWS